MTAKVIKGIITNIQHFSLHDGPGIRTTVFFKGCQLKCVWCHNPENINPNPEMMYSANNTYEKVGREVTVSEVVDEVIKDKMFYKDSQGGVTFSGGEPTMQYEFLTELLTSCKLENIHTAIETNLFFSEDKIKELDDSVDLIICDLKILDNRKHILYTGVDNSLILRNINEIVKRSKPLIIRIPLINGVNNDDNDIGDFINFLNHINLMTI